MGLSFGLSQMHTNPTSRRSMSHWKLMKTWPTWNSDRYIPHNNIHTMEQPPPCVKSANDAAVTDSTAPAEQMASPIASTDDDSANQSSEGRVQILS